MSRHQRIVRLFAAAGALVWSAGFAAPAAGAELWKQIGRGGFAGSYRQTQYELNTMCVFKGKLHIGTRAHDAASVWSYDGQQWAQVLKPETGESGIDSIGGLAVLGDRLYAGVRLNGRGCAVWRTDGSGGPPYKWTKISSPSNIETDDNEEITSLAVAQKRLWAGTYSGRGCEVWTYDGAAWSQAVGQGAPGTPTGPGFGDKNNNSVISMAASAAGHVFFGTSKYQGADVWRWDGSQMARINRPGFGLPENFKIPILVFYKSSLYAITFRSGRSSQAWKYVGPNPENWKAVSLNGCGDPANAMAKGAAVFGSPACLYVGFNNYDPSLTAAAGPFGCTVMRYNGAKWEKANSNGFGDPAIRSSGALQAYGDQLYAGADAESGGLVYATRGGKNTPHDWTLKNEPGFTSNANGTAASSAYFLGSLYVGTTNPTGCEVWRRQGSTWRRVAEKGFGNKNNYRAMSMAAVGGALYVGTGNYMEGCEVWRHDGSAWTRINRNGFGDSRTTEAASMILYNGKLYVGTQSYDTRARVWRFDGPGPAHWTKVNNDGFGSPHTIGAVSMAVFDRKLHVGTYDSNDPCLVWRYDGPDRSDWTSVSQAGFGDKYNRGAFSLCAFQGKLYAGTYNAMMTGGEVWRYDGSGTGWTKVAQDGLGTKNNGTITRLTVFSNRMYAAAYNWETGAQLWSYDGSAWSQSNTNGFGKVRNEEIASLATDGKTLAAGTGNESQGCEVWVIGAGAAAGELPCDLGRYLRPVRRP